MDFTPSQQQEELVALVDRVVESTGGPERARRLAVDHGYDAELDGELRRTRGLAGLGLLERVLVAERLAELGTATTFGLAAVVLGGADIGPLEHAVAVVDARRSGLARYAAQARTLIVVDGDEVRRVDVEPGSIEAVPSGTGFPVGQVPMGIMAGGAPLVLAGAHARWALAVAAEIGGTATRVVSVTASHLREREQFGRPLSRFQALRHRIANDAVDAESARWMAREAAYSGDAWSMWVAASRAAAAAAALSPEAVQLWGARGFAHEFGISNPIMRLQGLRLELGAADRLAHEALEARSASMAGAIG